MKIMRIKPFFLLFSCITLLSMEDTCQVTIKTSAASYTLSVTPNTTIVDIKNQLCTSVGIPVMQQSLQVIVLVPWPADPYEVLASADLLNHLKVNDIMALYYSSTLQLSLKHKNEKKN